MNLVYKNHETIWFHALDPKCELDLGKAKHSCRRCCGTGVVGRMRLTGVRVVCKCVVKADYELREMLRKEEEKKQTIVV